MLQHYHQSVRVLNFIVNQVEVQMIKAVLRDTSIQIHLRITRFSLVIMAHLRKMPGCLSLLLFSVTWKAVLRDLFHLSMQELTSIVFFDEVDFIHYDSFSL